MEAAETVQGQPRVLDKVLPGPGVQLSRAVFYVLLALMLGAGVWAAFTRVDVVVRARGRLVVEGEPVKLSVPEAGMVVEAPVQVGRRVEKGDVLLRLDAFRPAAEAAQIEAEQRTLKLEGERHRSAAAAERDLLVELERERALAEKSAVILAGQVKALKDLFEKGSASAFQVDAKEQELNGARAQIVRLEGEGRRREGAAALLVRQAEEVDSRLAGLVLRLGQLRRTEGQMTLTAPASGTVTAVAVAHPGSVLTPAVTAFVIMPDGRPLRAELRVPNASMRRLRASLPVRMRLDAYPHQDWGVVEGTLLSIDPDADGEGHYKAEASLAVGTLKGTEVLRAGLQFEADVIVERKSLLDYALDPFRRLGEPVTVVR